LPDFRQLVDRWGAYLVFPILVLVGIGLLHASAAVAGLAGILSGLALLVVWAAYRLDDEQ
jgi:hypothetical protein